MHVIAHGTNISVLFLSEIYGKIVSETTSLGNRNGNDVLDVSGPKTLVS